MEWFSMPDWVTPEILLTIYASIISTIALVWNIVLALLEKWSRLIVSVEFRDSMTAGIDGKVIRGPTVCFIRIVNKGNQVKYVSSIDLSLPYRTSTGNMFSLINPGTKFPVEILPQQEKYKEGKCRIIVVDTIRKKYKSHSFNADMIKRAFEHNNSLSPLVLSMFESDAPLSQSK